MKASQLSLEGYKSFLLKGPYGFGKTIAACSFAALGPVKLNYFDKKEPIELVTFFRKHRPNLLDYIEFESYGSSNAHEYLNDLIKLTKDCRYVAVITDSVTQLTSSAVNWSMGFRDVAKGAKKDPKNPGSVQLIPDFDEYKVETSLVTQALDITKSLPCHNIWIAHPVPSIKIEGSGAAMRVTKTNPIVTYGSKVAGIVPGNFSEIYHFAKDSEWDAAKGASKIRYKVITEAVGDDFAKTALPLPRDFDITDKLFYEVWRDALKGDINELKK